MKKHNLIKSIAVAGLISLIGAGCSTQDASEVSSANNANFGGNSGGGGGGGIDLGSNSQGVAYVAGNGGKVSGAGASSVPTADAIVARIQNGLQNNANPNAGNCKTALAALKSNLPKSPDPMQASGYDQAQLLVYACCSDITKNGTLASKYQITANGTIASNQAKLIAAGILMLDQYVGGLASNSAASSSVSSAFTSLVSNVAGAAGNTSTIAFMSVCIAANTAGSVMMGF